MTRRFAHSEHVWQRFPRLAAAALIVDAVDHDGDVAGAVETHLRTARERAAGTPESELAAIGAWRRVYTQMGLKPTQFRSAAESLLRRLRTHGELPRMHPLVDLCNAVSAAHAMPIAVLDLDRVDGDLIVGPATGVETYVTFSGETEHPAAGEIIYADGAGFAHSRRWVTRQSGRSAIGPRTTRALVVAEAVHDSADADVDHVLNTLTEEISAHWGTTPAHRRLSMGDPAIELDGTR